MKIYKGKKRLAKKLLYSRKKRLLEWAVTLQPGDWVASCEGCNRQVKDVTVTWVNEGEFNRGKPNKTWVVWEVEVLDTAGGFHTAPGGGCVMPPESVKEIEDYHHNFARAVKENPDYLSGFPELRESALKFKKALDEGRPIVDENGQYLPEFDRKRAH